MSNESFKNTLLKKKKRSEIRIEKDFREVNFLVQITSFNYNNSTVCRFFTIEFTLISQCFRMPVESIVMSKDTIQSALDVLKGKMLLEQQQLAFWEYQSASGNYM